jgi:hypothetical protein
LPLPSHVSSLSPPLPPIGQPTRQQGLHGLLRRPQRHATGTWSLVLFLRKNLNIANLQLTD